MFWRIKDFFTNTFLDIRLWYFINFKTQKFINVNNQIEKEGWELTFNDEFDKGDLDREKWRTDAYYGLRFHPSNITEKNIAPDMYYADDAFDFENSIMKQKVEKTPIEIHYVDWDGRDWGNYTIPYRIGQIDSSKSFEQKYGYFEIRSKITDQPGHWPAFWLASTYAWPPEIDIYEIYTGKKNGLNNFESNFHWNPSYKKRMKVKGHKVLDVSKNFHVYAVEWDEKGFKIYYNNLLVRVFSNPKAIKFFEHPMHIIINNGVDSREDRKLNESKFPTYHEVDYVRAYKKRGV
jgi:beta-glucanase (GH16 family)